MAANIAFKPFGKKAFAVAVEPAKLRFRHSHKLKQEPVTRKGRFGGRLLFLWNGLSAHLEWIVATPRASILVHPEQDLAALVGSLFLGR
jgi:hypothetical protein